MSWYFSPRWTVSNGAIAINSNTNFGSIAGEGSNAIVTVNSNALRCAFSYAKTSSLYMRSLKTVKSYGMYEAFRNATISGTVDISNLETVESYGLYGIFESASLNRGAIHFGSSIKTIGDCGLQQAFADTKDIGVGSNRTQSINFDALTSIGSTGMSYAFTSSEICSDVSFGALEEVTNNYALRSCFDNNTELQSASFPKLKRITGASSFNQTFGGCTSLTSVSFPLLEEIGTNCCSQMFRVCTGLTSVSLPSIDPSKTKITGTSSSNNALYRMFFQCRNITALHFPASLSSYSNYLTKAVLFGGTSASYCNANLQILFDL